MTSLGLWLRSLRFYRRTHVGVLAAVAVATAVLVGALVTGDTVRHSMRRIALHRLGGTGFAVISRNRLFAAEVAGRIDPQCAAVLQLPATAETPDGSARAGGVNALGVDEAFGKLSAADELPQPGEGECVVNAALAERLQISAGEEIVLSVFLPGPLPVDAPLSGEQDTKNLSLRVAAVASAGQLGNFALTADQQTPLNVFVRRDALSKLAGRPGAANLLLMPRHLAADAAQADELLRQHWRLSDAGLEFRTVGGNTAELRSERVFLDPVVSRAAAGLEAPVGVLTYFVNTFAVGEVESPYSFAAAVGALGEGTPESQLLRATGELGDDEAVVNDWLARDLGADVVHLNLHKTFTQPHGGGGGMVPPVASTN
ncbi:MAG: hypothetical protein ACP5HU_10885, partial [Phycisphaerae bacterium]